MEKSVPHKQCEVSYFCEHMACSVLFSGFIFKYILHSYMWQCFQNMCSWLCHGWGATIWGMTLKIVSFLKRETPGVGLQIKRQKMPSLLVLRGCLGQAVHLLLLCPPEKKKIQSLLIFKSAACSASHPLHWWQQNPTSQKNPSKQITTI